MGTAVKGMTMAKFEYLGKRPETMPRNRDDWVALSADEKIDLLMMGLEEATVILMHVQQAHNNLVQLLAGQPESEPTIVVPGKEGMN
jgi:hypothetical protein